MTLKPQVLSLAYGFRKPQSWGSGGEIREERRTLPVNGMLRGDGSRQGERGRKRISSFQAQGVPEQTQFLGYGCGTTIGQGTGKRKGKK